MHGERLTEVQPDPSETGSVLSDIGGDIGAAVVYTPSTLAGLEIEIRRARGEWDGTHTAVRERHVQDRVIWAAFFGSLRAGDYELRVRGSGAPAVRLHVDGGHVAETRW
jgi:hypothetical protein